jgi:hypothetical protein
MKTFSNYLTESKKVYEFKVGVAGDLPEHFEEHVKVALQKYGLSSLNKGKKTPIQERPLDFPQLKNMEVHYFTVELAYPTTSEVLKEYLGKVCSVHVGNIMVRAPGEMLEQYQDNATTDAPYETALTTEELPSTDGQGSVGESRVMELLKELEKVRKEREHDPSAAAPEAK